MKIKINEETQNITLIDSWLIEDKPTQLYILTELYKDFKWFRARSIKSYLREWRAHNRMYKWGWFQDHTKDVDLNVDEKWYRRLCYFFLGF